jgi:hypothetical protein
MPAPPTPPPPRPRYQTMSDFSLNAVRQLYLQGNAYALCMRNARYRQMVCCASSRGRRQMKTLVAAIALIALTCTPTFADEVLNGLVEVSVYRRSLV